MIHTLSFDRVAVIGDIHGCLDLLRALLARLDGRPVLVAGDVCDRGPDTRGVLDALAAIGARGVLGNHDRVFLDWLQDKGLDDAWLKPHMGGRATLASYGVTGTTLREIEPQTWRVPREHREWLEGLALAVDLEVAGERFWLIHAGIPTRRSLAGVPFDEIVPWLVRTFPSDLLWAGNDPHAALSIGRPVIMGHMSLERALVSDDVIAIDTGAGTLREGALSAVLLPEREVVTVR